MNSPQWDARETELLERLWDTNLGISQMAARIGRSIGACQKRAKRIGLAFRGYKEWTPRAEERLRALWPGGASTAEIGKLIGYSKGAVVGKRQRLGLPERKSGFSSPRKRAKPKSNFSFGAQGAPARARISATPPELPAHILPDPPINERVLFLNLTAAQCKWPLWGADKTEPRLCCGRKRHARFPYCIEHARRAHA